MRDSMIEPLRVAVIGAGKMAQAHLGVLNASAGVNVCLVTSQSGVSAERLAAKYKIPLSGIHSKQILEEAKPDACVIAVSHGETLACSYEAVDVGAHVLIEKPVALEPDAVRQLAADADRRGSIAMVAMNRRFYESVTNALAMIKYYGPVESVMVVGPDPVAVRRASGNYDQNVYDNWTVMNTIHLADTMRLLCGDCEWLSGAAHRAEFTSDASRVAAMRFASGAVGSYLAHVGLNSSWTLTICCRDMQIELSPLEFCAIRVGGRTWAGAKVQAGPHKPGLQGQMQAFLDSIRRQKLIGRASGLDDHARTLEFAHQLQGLACCA